MSAPRVSVVIPTYSRRARLARVLDSLRKQTIAPLTFEVVVVDDGSTDDTVEWLRGQEFPYHLELQTQRNSGPAVARNTGIQIARGDVVLFVDDDVVPVPELLAQHLKVHDEDSAEVVVLGPLSSLPHYEQPWIAWEQLQLERQYAAMRRGDWEPTYRQFWTGNASVGREHLIEAGLFDVTFLRGEDVELGRRLAARGLEFRFNPHARGYHHAERSLKSFCVAHQSYGRLEVEVFGKLSGEDVVDVLGGNLGRLHPAQREFVLRAIEHPRVLSRLDQSLQRLLESPIPRRIPQTGRVACSLLANLHYWSASAEALGPDRFRSVCERAVRERAKQSVTTGAA